MSGTAGDDAYDRLRRRVLWLLSTGLYVVGSRATIGEAATRWNLMTANLVVQVCLEPKLVAVAVEAGSVTRSLVAASGAFTVSLLGRHDRAVVRRFVKPVVEVELGPDGQPQMMSGVAVHPTPLGPPVLEGAAAWIACEVREQLVLGSHVLFVGEVADVDGPPPGDTVEPLRMEDTRMNYGG